MTAKANGCANGSTEPRPYSLDELFAKVGQFGKFQILLLALIFTLGVFHTVIKFTFIFTTSEVGYRCRVPECDGLDSSYDEPWTDFSIPKRDSGKLEKCRRYQPSNLTAIDEELYCRAENYDKRTKIECGNDFVFKGDEVTISNDFEIFCGDEWKLAMVGSVWSVGQILGAPFGGFFSDRYGRSKVLGFVCFTCAVLGILRSFSTNYYVFVAIGLIDNFLGGTIYSTAYVLAVESSGTKFRTYASVVLPICGACGRLVGAIAAKNLLDWRWIERALYTPALAFVLLPWILPESFRWLLSQGREEKAIETIQRTARVNNRKLSEASIDHLKEFNRQSLANDTTKKRAFPIWDALKLFPWRIINCSLCWFANNMIFVGLSMVATLLGDNKYNSYMYSSLIEIPGILLASLTLNCFGRRLSLSAYLFLSATSIAAMAFVSPSSHTLRLIIHLCGKMTISASTTTLFVFIAEVFPTNVRNGMLSFCSMVGRIGSIVAPLTPLMAKYYEQAPTILFASFAFLSTGLVLFLPETKDTDLPATLQDAENIGHKEGHGEHKKKEVRERY